MALVVSLADTGRPSFLFGCTPPLRRTPEAEVAEIARKFADRGRVLAVDGYIVYDVQDESIRTEARRPFPYRKLAEPCAFASHLRATSHKDCLVYKAVTCMESVAAYEEWLEACVTKYKHGAINVVGAPSAKASFHGPSTKEASLITSRRRGIRFGAVCIAERHMVKANEHMALLRKQSWGAEWFVSQGIYDAEPMVRLISDYAAACRESGVAPRKIILTFTPCGRRKTLEFVRWLGMHVPDAVEEKIFADQEPLPAKKRKTPVQLSCDVLCENLRSILQRTAGCGVPLGINIESVSGYKDEIDATHDLFRSLQAILLDSQCSPWVIRWSSVPESIEAYNAKQWQRRVHLVLVGCGAALGGYLLGKRGC